MWVYDDYDRLCNIRYAREVIRTYNLAQRLWYIKVRFVDGTERNIGPILCKEDCDKTYNRLAQKLKVIQLRSKT